MKNPRDFHKHCQLTKKKDLKDQIHESKILEINFVKLVQESRTLSPSYQIVLYNKILINC